MSSSLSLFATAPKGLENLLVTELKEIFSIVEVSPTRAGVAFQGTLAQAYQICLWSRLANRVLLSLATFSAPDPEMLYQGVQSIHWAEHLTVKNTFAVDFTSLQSNIKHTHFGALKVKDAIVDQFRSRYQIRPSIALLMPDIRINVHLRRNQATVSLDLSGDSLHRRGYREVSVQAPLKENLAAAILMQAGWQKIAQAGGTLLDPMCGSGTLPIEAALMAADIAPGFWRNYFGFLRWQQHEPALWAELLAEAQERKAAGLPKLPQIIGYDADANAVRIALSNVERAGLRDKVHIERRALAQLTSPQRFGLLVVNPPHGERLGHSEELKHLYNYLGSTLKTQFQGWQATVLAGNQELGKQLGIRAKKIVTLYNGALECKLLHFDIAPKWFMHDLTVSALPWQQTSPNPLLTNDEERIYQPSITPVPKYHEGAQMFANRLKKNLKTIGRWAKREQVSCFRLYDADLPEYAFAIDIYEQWVHVQEYAPPKTIDVQKAQTRLQEALEVIAEVLAVPRQQIFLKVRRQQKGKAQYQKSNNIRQFYEVREGKAIFLVNFTDYLDTGLFLDHRLTRQMVQSLASGQRFLNLFGYTGTMTINAALGGATATTTVDLSKTYLAWARRNLARNGFSDHRHQFIQADCLTWLQQEAQRLAQSPRFSRYGLIFLDPPTFSNSKHLNNNLDVQRDHVTLIRAALNCLNYGGVLLFSTHYQRFKMNTEALTGVQVENISHLTLPKDFERKPRIHQCWKIQFLQKK